MAKIESKTLLHKMQKALGGCKGFTPAASSGFAAICNYKMSESKTLLHKMQKALGGCKELVPTTNSGFATICNYKI